MENVEFLLEKLFNFYNVSSAAELSGEINVSQKTISNWKTRNSINAVKKKCRELGIYKDIFGDINIQSQSIDSQNGNNSMHNSGLQIQNSNSKKENAEIDNATLTIFKEAYKKAKDKNNVNDLRVYLMDYN